MKFTVIDQSSTNFAAVQAALANATSRFDYNELARTYNKLTTGAILQFEYAKAKIAMLAKQLEKRGLKRDQDYTLVGATEGESKNEVAFLTRLSTVESNIVTAGPRGPRKAKAKAADAPADAPAKAADGPAKAKTK